MFKQKLTCWAIDCDAPAAAWGLCSKHYRRIKRNGHARERRVDDRFADLAEEDENGCWVWRRPSTTGYGVFFPIRKQARLAHRWSFEFFRAPIPEGLEIDHLCRNRACVNPWHLDPVDRSTNVRRIYDDKCPNGHPYAEDTEIHPRGHRECRSCRRARERRFQARQSTQEGAMT